jgi:hypothetical protein
MLSTGVRPYHDKPHKQLIQEICSGLRPNVISGTPPVFAKLMLQCLDAIRSTASQLCDLGNWVIAMDYFDPSDLSNQFDTAEATKFVNVDILKPCHENAVYFSRPLDSIY